MTVADRAKARSHMGAWLRRHPGLAEFGIVGACLLIYYLIRGGVVDKPAIAFAHAVDVIRFERHLGFFWEPGWQKAVLGNRTLLEFWNDIYFWAHAPVIALIAFWLYFRHRRWYRLLRNAFLISCLIGLIMYAAYPVAPPRLMTPSGYAEYHISGPAPSFGFVDTMAKYSQLDYQAESLKPFVNPFAAVPSLHFGWSFLIAIGVWLARRNIFGALFAVAMPAVMFFAVVLTANHYIFDAITGFAVCLFALAIALALARWPLPARRLLRTISARGAGDSARARGLQPERE